MVCSTEWTAARTSTAALTVIKEGGQNSTVAPWTIDRVAWLQGCWELSSGNRVVEEQWTRPRGGIMLGVGRTTRDGRLV